MSLRLADLSPAQRRAYDLRHQPPPWLSPAPQKPVQAPEPCPAPEPPGARANAVWPRLHAFLTDLSARHRPLPYREELLDALRCDASTLRSAQRALTERRLAVWVTVPKHMQPSEARVVLASGAVLETRGWK